MQQIEETPQPVLLPQIRQDLHIEKAAADANGEPCWLLHDKLKNSYFRISEPIMQLLKIWQPIEPKQLLILANRACDGKFCEDDIMDLSQFLYANSLSVSAASGGYKGILAQSNAGNKSWWMALIHNYLFFRIPLFSPQKFLDASWPLVRWLFTGTAVKAIIILAVISLYFVSRQWQFFVSTFASFISIEGLMLYSLSLIMIKSLHELGHAFMARRYNIEVPVIGAAFIVMMPILYTDTTGAWRLQSRRQRLMIDMAGIFTELSLAAICTFAWVFLPEGNLRAIAFTTATLSWVLSLTVNLNPFMKFDGYYILSDWLGFENLQDRSFAMAKWWLRERLFAIDKNPPEILEPKIRRFIIAHAIGVWIYRFFLFLGIALLVYHFFFKILGLFMFAVELYWFIALPILREIKEWWKMREEIKMTNGYVKTSGFLLGAILIMAIPWSNSVRAPAILTQARETAIHVPFAAKLTSIDMVEGTAVRSGEILMQLASPELDHKIENAMIEKRALDTKLMRAHANSSDRAQLQVLQKHAISLTRKLAGLRQKQAELIIKAPHDGQVVDSDLNLNPGQWVNTALQLAIVRSKNAPEFKALIADDGRIRISNTAEGYFYPDNISIAKIPVRLTTLPNIAGAGQELAYLDEASGSWVPSTMSESGSPVAQGAWYALRFHPDYNNKAANNLPLFENIIRGVIILRAKPQSLLTKISRQVASVLVREAGI